MSRDAPLVLHASAVAFCGRGVLILGPAGAGKSTLALAMMARGACLISDDRTCLGRRGADLLAWAPPTILGRIEARRIGILPAKPAPPTPIALAVDLGRAEQDRIPHARTESILGVRIPLHLAADQPAAADILIQILRGTD